MKAIRGRPAAILVQLSWTHEERGPLEDLAKRAARYARRHRRHRLIVLANTQKEHDLLAARGLDVVFCNGSIFLSTEIFRPLSLGIKPFKAVYDAVLSPYKRHYLASGIEDLALITYTKHDSGSDYIRSTMDILPEAAWLNGRPDREITLLGPAEVNRCINSAGTGLCLSATEGFMFASAQYLLAGLPVVTTRSKGGRDVFYDPGYVRTVDDDPKAVSAAVSEFLEDCPLPESVRNATLNRFRPFRTRFAALMRDLLDESDSQNLWSDGWPDGLPNKLEGSGFTREENLLALKTPGQAPPWFLRRNSPGQQGPQDILADYGKVERQ